MIVEKVVLGITKQQMKIRPGELLIGRVVEEFFDEGGVEVLCAHVPSRGGLPSAVPCSCWASRRGGAEAEFLAGLYPFSSSEHRRPRPCLRTFDSTPKGIRRSSELVNGDIATLTPRTEEREGDGPRIFRARRNHSQR